MQYEVYRIFIAQIQAMKPAQSRTDYTDPTQEHRANPTDREYICSEAHEVRTDILCDTCSSVKHRTQAKRRAQAQEKQRHPLNFIHP